MKKEIKEFFKITPAEDRQRDLGVSFVKWLLKDPRQILDNERYLPILAAKNTFIASLSVGTFIIFLFFVTDYLGHDYFVMNLLPDNETRAFGFVGRYSYFHSLAMGYVVLLFSPFYLFLLHVNTPKDQLKIFKHDPILKDVPNRTALKILNRIFLYIAIFLLAYIAAFYGYSIHAFPWKWGWVDTLKNSSGYLLFTLLFISAAQASASGFMFIPILCLYGLIRKSN